MKKKSISKILALALAGVMAFGLTACGGSSSSSSGSASEPAQSSSEAAPADTTGDAAAEGGEEAAAPIERQTITWSVIDLNAGNNNVGNYAEEIFQKIEDYVGHDIELTWVNNDALSEKNSLYYASPSTMPMIMPFHHADDHVLRRHHDR